MIRHARHGVHRARTTGTIPWAGGRPRGPRVKGYQRTVVDGIAFHSKAEARRWGELALLEKAGAIRNLRRQVRFTLYAFSVGNIATIPRHGHVSTVLVPAPLTNASAVSITDYIADFVYEEAVVSPDVAQVVIIGWPTVVEDVKGMKTDVYKLKKRWFEAQTGQTIRETMPARVARRRKR